MKEIELARWKPSTAHSGTMEYAGQPTAQEVFVELKERLDGMGLLPDEYFLLDIHWKDGQEIPRGADIFCTTDYGSSEGIYLDVYLKWFDEQQRKSVTRGFITGKTLGENGNDLDRMFLISSAITKAFHGDHAGHTRAASIGGEDMGGRVIHLSQQEEKVILNALLEQRERQEEAMSQTEQLLRRMTGSITAYMDAVGHLPLCLSDYDRTVLSIRDGELPAFRELYSKVLDAHGDDLLIQAAGRPGMVGRQMTLLLLESGRQFTEPIYRAACQKAVDIDDLQKVTFLLEQSENYAQGLSLAFYGELASYAHMDHRLMAKEIIGQCSDEQIAAAPSRLLEQFAMDKDWRTLSTLVEKGISGGSSSAKVLHMLTYQKQDQWIAEELLEKRMWVNTNDYAALRACVENDAAAVAELLLDGGMDFDQYLLWAQGRICSGHEDTMQMLAAHWTELQEQQAQPIAPGPTMGGMSL